MNTDKLLEDVSGRYARLYFAAIHELYVAKVSGDKPSAAAARRQLAQVMQQTMGVGEVLGASLLLQNLKRTAQFAAEEPTQTLLPRVTFEEALDDMVERAPVTLVDAAERTAQRIAQLYSEDAVMAFVRSAEETVTREASEFIQRALRSGVAEGEAGRKLAMKVDDIRKASQAWSEGYARMVFRTNINTAISAGRFRQAQDPDIQEVAPAFRFDAVGDGDTRNNHDAADGLIMSVNNPEWRKIAPPLGYNCRCQVVHVTRYELERMGRIRKDGSLIEDKVPAGAFSDPGFRHGGRPDLAQSGR
jgi:SPP1 gp7 family putative phage head morphogenesis protein